MTGPGAYLVGRKTGDWPAAASPARDLLFAAVRKDGETLEGVEFEHCTFANVSFKEVELRQCSFIDCAFLDCYFRKTRIVGTSFIGCKFLSCDFPKTTIQSCDFKYSRFEDCSIPFDELEHSLPREPNLREDLARGLAISSDALGLLRDGRRYRLAAIRATEEHLRAAVLSNSEWYSSHYRGLRKLAALVQLIASKANGAVWGHGEKWFVLMRNLLVLALVVFPTALWFSQGGLARPSGSIGIGDLVWLSVTTIIPVNGVNSVAVTGFATRSILTVEAFLGVVIAGLFITLLVRAMLKR